MTKILVYIVFFLFFSLDVSAQQEENYSKWSVSFSVTPHSSEDYYSAVVYKHSIFENYFFQLHPITPAVYVNAVFQPCKFLSLQAGLGYNYYNTTIVQENPYLMEYGDDYAEDNGIIALNATIHFLELPGTVNLYLLSRKRYKIYVSVGDISSFVIAETNAADYGQTRVQTTIYQNYLQFALGFELKARQQWSFYASPLYRMALVNYYDSEHYDIYAYPNVFYERMLGVEIGAKYNFLRKKAVPSSK